LHERSTRETMVKPQGQRRPDAKKAKNTSVAKRIRDVKRLLSKVRPYTLCVSRLGTLVHLTYAQPTSVLQDTIDTKMRQSLEKKLALLEQESVENKTRLREQKYAVRYVSPRDGRASCWCPEVEGLPLDVELRPGGHSVVFAPPFLTSVHSSCRYHKVRFFERIKLERRIHKLEKALKQGVNVEETRKKLSSAREDLEYVLHFPKGEKFVSLLKDAEDAEAQAHLERERARLRALVKQQLRDDAIVNELHEGRVQESDDEDAPEGTAGDGFAQELQEDDFFANPSDEERGSSDEDIHSIDDRGSEERGSEERGSEERGSEGERSTVCRWMLLPVQRWIVTRNSSLMTRRKLWTPRTRWTPHIHRIVMMPVMNRAQESKRGGRPGSNHHHPVWGTQRQRRPLGAGRTVNAVSRAKKNAIPWGNAPRARRRKRGSPCGHAPKVAESVGRRKSKSCQNVHLIEG
jgi:hypothetical protein